MANIQKILDFYGYETAEGRCRCYQEVQRAREEMANILINGGKKYNKDRRKNYKNHRRKKKEKKKKGEESSERPEKQWRPQRNIYDREKIPVVAFGSEMFRKDSVCNSCDKMAFTSAFINPHGIQSCTECGLLWQRDINASKNIFKIANGILRGCGRPQAFLRRIEHCSPSGL
ncbi:hypothetical protein AB4K20DRAFT_1941871 [Rhizopus microsporus]|uniref:Uncharacterized protein n=1 Tax=Rhizopus microsporus TaxID=58291 RepID=A0A1X0RZ92_RHIZD|nr:hypothetical protein BCV71DRAFT_291612 [Rhizopus microsporus]